MYRLEEQQEERVRVREEAQRRFSQGSAESEFPDYQDNYISPAGFLVTGTVRHRLPLAGVDIGSASKELRARYPLGVPRSVRLDFLHDRIAQRESQRAQLRSDIAAWENFCYALGPNGGPPIPDRTFTARDNPFRAYSHELTQGNLFGFASTQRDLAEGRLFTLNKEDKEDRDRIAGIEARISLPNPINPEFIQRFKDGRGPKSNHQQRS